MSDLGLVGRLLGMNALPFNVASAGHRVVLRTPFIAPLSESELKKAKLEVNHKIKLALKKARTGEEYAVLVQQALHEYHIQIPLQCPDVPLHTVWCSNDTVAIWEDWGEGGYQTFDIASEGAKRVAIRAVSEFDVYRRRGWTMKLLRILGIEVYESTFFAQIK
jgi:hypothetical protein